MATSRRRQSRRRPSRLGGASLRDILGGGDIGGYAPSASPSLNNTLSRILASNAPQEKKDEAGGIFGAIGSRVSGALGGVLEAIDTPRAALTSTAFELVDLARGDGFSLRDIVRDTRDNVGFGSHLERRGLDTGNIWADRFLGFVGDVALDPLTYVTAGVAPAATKAGSTGARAVAAGGKISAQGVSRRLAEEGLEEAAARVLQRGVLAASSEELARVGLRKGLFFNVPGTGRLARGVARKATGGRVVPTQRLLKLTDARGVSAVSHLVYRSVRAPMRRTAFHKAVTKALGGRDAELKAIIRTSDDAAKVVAAQRIKDTARQLRFEAQARAAERTMKWRAIAKQAKQVGIKDDELLDLVEGLKVRNLTPEQEAVARRVADFLEVDLRQSANAVVGEEWIRSVEDYAPRIRSEEARAKLGSKSAGGGRSAQRLASFEKARLKVGDTFLGETLVAPVEHPLKLSVTQQIEEIAKRHYGDDAVRLFERRASKAIPMYIRSVSRREADRLLEKRLVEDGLATVAGVVEDIPVLADGTINPNHPISRALDVMYEAMDEVGGTTFLDTPTEGVAAAVRVHNQAMTDEALETLESLRPRDLQADPTVGPAPKLEFPDARLAPTRETAAVDTALDALRRQRDQLGQLSAEQRRVLMPTVRRLRKEAQELAADAPLERKFAQRQNIEDVLPLVDAERRSVNRQIAKIDRDIKKASDSLQRGDIDATARRVLKNSRAKMREQRAKLVARRGELVESARTLRQQARELDRELERITDPEVLANLQRQIDDLNDVPRLPDILRQQVRADIEDVRGLRTLEGQQHRQQVTDIARQRREAQRAAQREVRGATRTAARHEKRAIRAEARLAAPKVRRQIQREIALRRQAEFLFRQAETVASTTPAVQQTLRLQAQALVAWADLLRRGINPTTLEGFRAAVKSRKDLIRHMDDLIAEGMKKFGPLSNLASQEWVVDAIAEMADAQVRGGTQGFLKYFDKVTDNWKALALLTPGYHMRNLFGGMYMNFLADVDVGMGRVWAGVYKNWRKALKQYGGDVELALAHMSRGNKYDRLFPEIWRSGVISQVGQAGADIDVNKLRRLTAPIGNAQHRAAVGVETHLRGTMALDTLLKGGTPQEALDRVLKYHFDYTDMSRFEANVMRRVVPFYCVPEDHEILTKRGWKRHHELVEGEPVMVLDPETHQMRWEPLLGVSTFDFDGELRTFERRGAKFLFTDDHRWPVEVSRNFVKGKWYGGERGILRTHQLKSNHKIPLKGQFVDDGDSLLSPRHAAILGWIVTDGYARWRGNHWEALVYQSPNKLLPEILELLGTEPRKPHPNTGVVPVPVAHADREVIKKHYHDKDDLPSLVTQLSREAAEAMWTAMFQAEGSSHEKGGDRFSQVDGPVLEAFQILSLMTGRTAWVSGEGAYVRRQDYLHVKEGMGRERYKGTIWCPTTPTGTWIMRHDGAVIPTGNSWMRFNFPLQLEQLIANPGKVNKFLAVKRNMELGLEEEGVVPAWFGENLPIRLPFHLFDGGTNYVMPDLPLRDLRMISDIGEAAQGDISGLMTRVNPFLKVPFELSSGEQFFNHIPFREGYVKAPSYVTFIPGVAPALEKAGLLHRAADGSYMTRDSTLYALESALPVLGRARRLVPNEPKYSDRASSTWVNFIFGAGLRVNTEYEQFSELARRRRKLEAMEQDLRSLGVNFETRLFEIEIDDNTVEEAEGRGTFDFSGRRGGRRWRE